MPRSMRGQVEVIKAKPLRRPSEASCICSVLDVECLVALQRAEPGDDSTNPAAPGFARREISNDDRAIMPALLVGFAHRVAESSSAKVSLGPLDVRVRGAHHNSPLRASALRRNEIGDAEAEHLAGAHVGIPLQWQGAGSVQGTYRRSRVRGQLVGDEHHRGPRHGTALATRSCSLPTAKGSISRGENVLLDDDVIQEGVAPDRIADIRDPMPKEEHVVGIHLEGFVEHPHRVHDQPPRGTKNNQKLRALLVAGKGGRLDRAAFQIVPLGPSSAANLTDSRATGPAAADSIAAPNARGL